jgi:hypothetical protein
MPTSDFRAAAIVIEVQRPPQVSREAEETPENTKA